MIKHRRWFLSAAGAAVISEIAGRLLVAKEALATAPSSPPAKATKRLSEQELKEIFLHGHSVVGGGLNPPKGDPQLNETVLDGKLHEHYHDRVAGLPSNTDWDLLSRQAAALGQLSRCMCLNVDTTSKGNLHVKHLEWAREALGFALNSSSLTTHHYTDPTSPFYPCGPIVISRRKDKKGKEPDQPCALC